MKKVNLLQLKRLQQLLSSVFYLDCVVIIMARICYFTGRKTTSGQTRSHSMRAGKRQFKVNLINKWIKLEDGSQVKVKINSRLYKKFKGFI